MNTNIYDKGSGDFVDKAVSAAASVFGVERVTSIGQFDDNRMETLRQGSLAVGHLTDADFREIIDQPLSNLNVIIRVSSQGRNGMPDSYKPPYRHSENGPWILHIIDRSADISSDQWRELFTLIKSWNLEEAPSVEIRSFFEPTKEHPAALRFLCEAWLLKHWAQANGYDRMDEVRRALAFVGEPSSLPFFDQISPPHSNQEWLEPFQMSEEALANHMPEILADSVKKFLRFTGATPTFQQVADLFLALKNSIDAKA